MTTFEKLLTVLPSLFQLVGWVLDRRHEKRERERQEAERKRRGKVRIIV